MLDPIAECRVADLLNAFVHPGMAVACLTKVRGKVATFVWTENLL